MKRLFTVFCLAASIAAVSGCMGPKNQVVEEKDEAVKVEVATAVFEDVPQVETYSSTVQAFVVNNVVPQSGNRITSIRAEVGDFVRAGQILAEMDKSNLNQVQMRLANDSTELGRLKELYHEGGISKSDYEAAELGFNVSKSSYQNMLENTVLRSPINGVVTARNYDQGDMYSMSSPIFVVQQITPVKLLVGVSEKDYTKVSVGESVDIEVEAIPGKVFEGKISRIYPTIDAASHTFIVEVQVPNTDRVLRPGMYAKPTITFAMNRSIVVPDSAVIKQQGSGQRVVYVVGSDNTVSAEIVSTGKHFDGKYEILSGLDEGAKVVTKGQTALKSGSKIEY